MALQFPALWRRLGAFVAPMITGNVLQLLTGTATAAMLGRLIDAHALASSGVIYPITLICYSLATGLTSGATILVSNAQGAQDQERVHGLTMEALALSAALGALFAAIGVGFCAPILHALGTPSAIFAQTAWYLRIVAVSMIVFLPYMMYGALLRGLGDSKTPFTMLVAITIASIALMPPLILGTGLPRLGVLGAPLASLIVISLVMLAAMLLTPGIHPELRVSFRSALPTIQTAREMLALGLPIACQYTAVSVSELVVLSIITTGGATALAVYAAMNQIVAYVMTPMTMIGIATSAFAAKELGAGRPGEIPAIGRTSMVIMLALTGAMAAFVYLFAKPILGLFLSTHDALDLAQRATFVMLWSVPVLGIGTIATSLSRSEKLAVGPMAANAIGVLLILLPCAKMLVAHSGIIGVWEAYPIAYLAIAAMEVAYFLYAWRRIRSSALGQPAPA